MDHCDVFGYALWATVQDFLLGYGLLRRILLVALAIAQDLVMHYGP
jgi:hypothetical protein